MDLFELRLWLNQMEAEARSGVKTQLDMGKAIAYQNVIDYLDELERLN